MRQVEALELAESSDRLRQPLDLVEVNVEHPEVAQAADLVGKLFHLVAVQVEHLQRFGHVRQGAAAG